MHPEPTIRRLKQMQSLPLNGKIEHTIRDIIDFYEKMNGDVYVAFSGGKDSTVLLHLVRKIYPEIDAVFSNTGLGYPEIKNFVKTVDNVEEIRPKMSYRQVIESFGYPVISKEQSMFIRQYRDSGSEYLRWVRWNGKQIVKQKEDWLKAKNQGEEVLKNLIGGHYKISNKWKFLAKAPFKISEQCCDVLKKRPFYKFEKETGLKPYIGLMADNSRMRSRMYLMNNMCNVFKKGKERSMPLTYWLEEDIWNYIKQENLSYSEIYDKGVSNTGCMFCLFGIAQEKESRFEFLRQHHPNLYNYCMRKGGLNLKQVFDFFKENGYDFLNEEKIK